MTTITIDRPPVNAMSQAVVAALESALSELATDATTHVALLRGAGARGFSAGADISEFPALLEPNADARGEGIQRLADRVEAFPKPIIAAIHGFCMGGGLEIALACDIRIAAEDARIGLPEVRIGILPGGGGTQRLPRAVGPGRARLMILSGEPISGRRAAEWGLVEEAVGPAEVFDRAAAIAGTLAAQSPHSLAVVLFKPGQTATADELRAFLAPSFAKWWLPDSFEFVTEIPKSAAGKFRKTALRERFATAREVTPAS